MFLSPDRRCVYSGSLAFRASRNFNLPCRPSASAVPAPTTSRSINLDLPRDRLIVLTGLSGSGKSSLAFDTLYAEGQRRYVESLSAYARQFLSMMDKPDVDSIEGLSPAIAIEQKAARTTRARPSVRSPRSTITCACCTRAPALPRCPHHGIDLTAQTVSQMVDQVLAPQGELALLLAPLVERPQRRAPRADRGACRQGFVRVRIDGTVYEIDAAPKLDPKAQAHDRGRGRSVPRAPRGGTAPGRIVRDCAAARQRPRARSCFSTTRAGAAGVLEPPRLPGVRLQRAAARAEAVLLQQPGRRLPDLRRPRRTRNSSIRSASWCTRTCRSPAARYAAGIGATLTTSS